MDVTTSYHNRCRLCIAEARLSLQLFETEAIRLDLVNKIRSYLSINVSMHDGLPQEICYECLSRIELFHSYKQSCLESQHTLKHWNLFCDGSVPQDVDIFSGRNNTTDIFMDAHSKTSATVMVKRKSVENINQHFKANEITPLRKSPILSSPVINKTSTATPLKRMSVNTALSEQMREISPQNRKKNLPEMFSINNSSPRRNTNESSQAAALDPASYLQITVKELNHITSIDGGKKPLKQVPSKCSQGSTINSVMKGNVDTISKHSRSPSPYHGRSQTPLKDINSCSPQEVSQLEKQDIKLKPGTEARRQSPGSYQNVPKSRPDKNIEHTTENKSSSLHPLTRSQTPLREIKSSLPEKIMPLTQKQATDSKSVVLESKTNSRSPSLDRLTSAENIASKSSPELSTIQIISVESLAELPEKFSKTKLSVNSPENNSLKVKYSKKSAASTSDKGNESETPTRSHVMDISEKPFASTISETVKQRKRSNSVSSQSYTSVKLRKPHVRTSPAVTSVPDGINKENSDSNLHDWTSDKEDNDAILSRNIQDSIDESDTRSVQSIDDSTQALLRLLESDDDDVGDDDDDYRSDFYQSDSENLESDSSRPGTPSSRNPMNAYVKVEKLSGGSDSNLHVRTEEELNARVPVRRGRPPKGQSRQQSNQYRLVKIVKDEITGRERYKCIKCGSLLSNKCYIKEHMKIHTGDKDFKCEKCGKAFRNNYMLKAHDAVHMKERNYMCSTCGSTFVQRDRLRQHFRVHTSEQLECTICGHKTNLKPALRRHMRIHTGERPYECEFCGGRYTDRSTWVNHRRIHTGERPFRCVTCNRTFNRKTCLRAHWRTHSDYRPFCCQLCLKRFKTKEALVKHLSGVHRSIMRSVVNFIKSEGTKDCKECGKTFSRIVYLQAHKRSHSNERPFSCHLCPSSFKTKAHLVKHLSCVHKELMESVVNFIKEEYPAA